MHELGVFCFALGKTKDLTPGLSVFHYGLIKPPRSQRLPDIVTVEETERIFLATQVLSYRVFFFT